MKRANRRDLLVMTAGAAVAVVIFVVTLLGGYDHPEGLPEPEEVTAEFDLVGEEGRTITLDALAGRYVLVTFGFTSCPDVCPTTLVRVADALKRIGSAAAYIEPVMITLDPARDGPKRLREYVNAFDPGIHALRGTPEDTRRVADSFGVRYRRVALESGSYTIDHTSALFLLAPDGDCVAVFPAHRDPGRLAQDLRRHLGGA